MSSKTNWPPSAAQADVIVSAVGAKQSEREIQAALVQAGQPRVSSNSITRIRKMIRKQGAERTRADLASVVSAVPAQAVSAPRAASPEPKRVAAANAEARVSAPPEQEQAPASVEVMEGRTDKFRMILGAVAVAGIVGYFAFTALF